MALHTALPIYKVTYDLLLLVTQLVAQMPRNYKADLGTGLRTECVELVMGIYRANSSDDKAPPLKALLERLETVNLTARVSMDLRLISKMQYAKLIDLTASAGKQAQGWLKHSSPAPVGRSSRRPVQRVN